MSRYGKSAGEKGGPPTRPTRTNEPEFIRLDRAELRALNDLSYPLAGWIYLILCQHSVFNTGEFLGGYPRLMELCTEPRPQQGPRVAGPTRKQVRRAVQALVDANLARRDDRNAAQGLLRLFIAPRKRSAA